MCKMVNGSGMNSNVCRNVAERISNEEESFHRTSYALLLSTLKFQLESFNSSACEAFIRTIADTVHHWNDSPFNSR